MNKPYDSEWILAVLDDLVDFAIANNLIETERAVRAALHVSSNEINDPGENRGLRVIHGKACG